MLATTTHDRSAPRTSGPGSRCRPRCPTTSPTPRTCAGAGGVRYDLDGHTARFVLQTVLGVWPAPRERLWPALQWV